MGARHRARGQRCPAPSSNCRLRPISVTVKSFRLVCVAAAALAAATLERVLVQVFPGGDAGRLPEGRGRQPVGRRSRPADAGAGRGAGLRNGGAVCLGRRRRKRRVVVHRHGKRRQGVPRRLLGARARCSSTAPSSRFTRWRRRRTAASMSPRRPTARSTQLDRNGVATTFFDPEMGILLQWGTWRRHRRHSAPAPWWILRARRCRRSPCPCPTSDAVSLAFVLQVHVDGDPSLPGRPDEGRRGFVTRSTASRAGR